MILKELAYPLNTVQLGDQSGLFTGPQACCAYSYLYTFAFAGFLF